MAGEAMRRDLLAGLSIAGLMLPEAVAYAGIAGLPPERAIIAGLVGLLAYALLGQSRFAVVAPTSSSAAILAATLAAMPGGPDVREVYATWIVLLTGGLFLAAALFRLGGLTGFISRPVLRGFTLGLAVTVILHQMPELLGLEAKGSNLATFLADLFRQLPAANPMSLALGSGSLALLLVLKRFGHLPGPLILLVVAGVVSQFVDLAAYGVQLVGPVHLDFAGPHLTWPGAEALSGLAQYSLPLVLILFAESWGTVRNLSLKHGETPGPDRELAAFALANLASALFRGMPVGAGFSAGNAMESAGAATRRAGLVTALALAFLVIFGGEVIARLPRAVPAAVVIAALSHALDPRPFLRLWQLGKDNLLAIGATLGVLAFGVLDGLLLAVALSLASLLHRISRPVIARLARLPGTRDYVDAARHPEATGTSDLVIFRPAAPLFYANADNVLNSVTARIIEDPAVRRVVLSLEESFDLDTTALDQLLEFDSSLRGLGYRLHFARVHDHVRDMFRLAGEDEVLSRCHYSVDDAVRQL